MHPTAQQLRCWVPAALRTAAAGDCCRWADVLEWSSGDLIP